MKKIFFISAFCGVFFAIITYIIMLAIDPDNSFLISFAGGLFFYLMLSFSLLMYEKIIDKRYSQAEKSIGCNIWYKFNGNITTAKSTRNANIYFTDSGVVFISLDKKPHIFETILLQNIEKYQTDYNIYLNIHTHDSRLFIITSAQVKEAVVQLKEKGWI